MPAENHFITSTNPSVAVNISYSSVAEMTSSKNEKLFASVLCLSFIASVTEASGRIKRDLRFPKGGSFVTGVALASLLPKGPTDGFAHVLEFDLGFPYPEKFSIGKKEVQKKINRKYLYKNKRTKRNLKESQREDLLFKLQDSLDRMGLDGFSCVTRFQCELLDIPQSNSLLARVLLTLFKPISKHEGKCKKKKSTCQVSLLQIILHSEEIPSSQMT